MFPDAAQPTVTPTFALGVALLGLTLLLAVVDAWRGRARAPRAAGPLLALGGALLCGGGSLWALAPPAPAGHDTALVSLRDRELRRAATQARGTLDTVLALAERPEALAVKVGVRAGSSAEYLWLRDVRAAPGRLSGTVANVPQWVGVRPGARLTVPRASVVDWLYVRGGRMYGAYTLRVHRSRLDPGERAAFDARLEAPLAPRPLERAPAPRQAGDRAGRL